MVHNIPVFILWTKEIISVNMDISMNIRMLSGWHTDILI